MSDDKQYPPPPLEVLYLISDSVYDDAVLVAEPTSVSPEDETDNSETFAPPLPSDCMQILVAAEESDEVVDTFETELPGGDRTVEVKCYKPIFEGKFSELQADGQREYLLIRPKWTNGRWNTSGIGVIGNVQWYGMSELDTRCACTVNICASQRRARVTGWERRDDPNRLDLATVEYLTDSGANDETTVKRAYELVRDVTELKFLSDHKPFVELADGDSADVDKRVRDAFRVQSVEELRSLGADGLWDIIRECIQRLYPSESYDTSDLRQLLLDSNDFADRIQQVQDLLTKAKRKKRLLRKNQYEVLLLDQCDAPILPKATIRPITITKESTGDGRQQGDRLRFPGKNAYVLLESMTRKQLIKAAESGGLHGVLGHVRAKDDPAPRSIDAPELKIIEFEASETRCRILNVEYWNDVDNVPVATVERCDDHCWESAEKTMIDQVRKTIHEIGGLYGIKEEQQDDTFWKLVDFVITHSPLRLEEKNTICYEMLNENDGQRLIEMLHKVATDVLERINAGEEPAGTMSDPAYVDQLINYRHKTGQIPPGMMTSIRESGIRQKMILVDLPYYPQQFPHAPDLKDAKKMLGEAIVTAPKGNSEMERAKEEILDHLANSDTQSSFPVLCLAGPPGTGKTTLAKAIADVLHRQLGVIPLGGLNDAATLRGFDSTYIQSQPGRIINEMLGCAKRQRKQHKEKKEWERKQNKANNDNIEQVGTSKQLLNQFPSNDPVIVLDEIDKLSTGNQQGGDPAAVLLAILDPQQNDQFTDDFLRVPYDLSNVVFIATANYVEDIPAPLRNRMEIIQLGEYTDEDKVEIAGKIIEECRRKFKLPDFMPENSSKEREIRIEAIDIIVKEYTKADPGARQLGRLLHCLARKAQRRIMESGNNPPPIEKICTITEEIVRRDLPKPAPLGHSSGGKLLHDFHERKVHMDPIARIAVKEVGDKINRPEKYSQLQIQHEIERGLLLTDLPWPTPNTNGGSPKSAKTEANAKSKSDKDKDWLEKVKKTLSSHTGLEQVKDKVIEYMVAQRHAQRHTGRISGKVLCLVGPPGVGKTSITESIAKATEWEYGERMRPDEEHATPGRGKALIGTVALGGVEHEESIRGDRQSPGKIIQAIRDVAKKYRSVRDNGGPVRMNPVIVLDEIDKLGPRAQAAMLEVLDPQQNHEFMDSYVGLPYDLSEVLFVATANYEGAIPLPLLDRMLVIELDGYTEYQKVKIAEEHIIAIVCDNLGLKKGKLSLYSDEGKNVRLVLKRIIREYTREAGVRQLTQRIETIAEKALYEITQKNRNVVSIDMGNIDKYLGKPLAGNDNIGALTRAGCARGLVVHQDHEGNSIGGGLMVVEVAKFPGNGRVKATGNIRQVMEESVEVALTYVRERLKDLNIDGIDRWDTHVHFPAGAQPKDGSSAGITIATALISAYTEKELSPHVAMTGELTVGGSVLRIGGVRMKLLAALREDMQTVIIPAENRAEVEEWLMADKRLENNERLENKMYICPFQEFKFQGNGSKMQVIPVQHMTEVVDVLMTLWDD